MAASRGDHMNCPAGMVINNRYKIVKECGCGNFSKVFECIDMKDNQNSRVAVKFLKREYASDASFERDILKALGERDRKGDAKVAKMLDFFVYNRYPTFVFPLKGPSLRSCKLGVTRGNVPQEEMRAFAKEMLQCLKFLHKDVKMVHTDIKPENILLDRSLAAGALGIGNAWSMCDFGSASFLRPDRLDSDLISTRPYRAPEVVMGQGWSTTADVWSMACVLFEVQAGSRLFEVHDDNDHLHAYVSRLGSKIPSIFTKGAKHSSKFFGHDGSFRRPSTKTIRPMTEVLKDTPELLDLLKQMLEFDPKKRISAEEALQHPFFAPLNSKPSSKASSAERIAEEAAAITKEALKKSSPNKDLKELKAGAAYPASAGVLQERASKLDNIQQNDVKVRKSDVKSASSALNLEPASNKVNPTGNVNSGRFMPQTNTVNAAMAMAKFKAGEISTRAVPAAGRPSFYSARQQAQQQQQTVGSGRYY